VQLKDGWFASKSWPKDCDYTMTVGLGFCGRLE